MEVKSEQKPSFIAEAFFPHPSVRSILHGRRDWWERRNDFSKLEPHRLRLRPALNAATLEEVMRLLVDKAPLVISFNAMSNIGEPFRK